MDYPLYDLHIHTFLSSCSRDPGQNPQTILEAAKAQGFSAIAYTNHYWDETMEGVYDWYRPQNTAHIRKLVLPENPGIRILRGCETDFRGGRLIGISRQRAEEMELIQLPIDHFHMKGIRGDTPLLPEALAKLWITRFEEALALDLPWEKVIFSHPTLSPLHDPENAMVLCLLEQYSDRLRRALDICAAKGGRTEVNVSDTPKTYAVYPESHARFYALVTAAGIPITWGSDAHHPGDLLAKPRFLAAATQLGLKPEHFYQI